MSEYISKEDISRVLLERKGTNESCLIKARELGLHESEQYFQNLVFEDEQIASLIEELSSADVRPNIHGHWIRHLRNDLGVKLNDCIECSACKTWFTTEELLRRSFCPNCGADMREPKGEKMRCNTCKNNDDEFSGECYECIKGIFDHYEPEEVEPNE